MARRLVKHTWGPYQVTRWRIFTALLLFFVVMPWVQIDGRPAIWLDIPGRKFNIFALTFWPQEVYLFSLVLITAAITLFAVTSILGRAWCTYTCPQTVGMSIFLEIERFIEGDRPARLREAKTPTMAGRLRRLGTLTAWLALSFLFSLNFGFFYTPAPVLLHRLATLTVGPSQQFFLFLFTLVPFMFFGLIKDMICRVPCPYGRFQSVMLDPHSLTVTYDQVRGEPRAFFRKGAEREAGACVSCNLCVDVCPTGVDIRKGPHADCVACMRCLDACNQVMTRIAFEPDLIKLASERNMAGETNRLVRGRTLWYAAVLVAVVSTLVYNIVQRPITSLDVVRNRSFLFQQMADGRIANVYWVKALNKDKVVHTYRLSLKGIDGELTGSPASFEVAPNSVKQLSIALSAKTDALKDTATRMSFVLEDATTGRAMALAPTTFLIPEELAKRR